MKLKQSAAKATKRFLWVITFQVLASAGTWFFLPSLAPAANSAAGRSARDGMAVLTGGAFTPLYSPEGTNVTLSVKTFQLDTKLVTRADYLRFVRDNPRWRRAQAPKIFRDAHYLEDWPGDVTPATQSKFHTTPVVNVSWFAARAYCKAQGKRLPTQTEWEYAALAGRREKNGKLEAGNQNEVLQWYIKPSERTLIPVGTLPANAWGIFDMHSSVWEWVVDFNASLSTGDNRADSDKERAVFCGGAAGNANDLSDYAAFMRFAYRSSLTPDYTGRNLGFRCAADF